MNAPGKSMIKVVSILMLIFSSISLIVLFVSLIGSAYIAAYHLGVGVILIFALIISFASVIFEFIAAILGLKHCGRPEKANSLFGIGVTHNYRSRQHTFQHYLRQFFRTQLSLARASDTLHRRRKPEQERSQHQHLIPLISFAALITRRCFFCN